jgi:ribosomal-protein-serine acetyltransferase
MFKITPWNEDHCNALEEALWESREDLEKWHAWPADTYHWDLMGALKWCRDCMHAWEKKTYYGFAIEDEEGKLVGSISIYWIEKFSNLGRVGYWVRSSRQREGAAKAAGELIKQFAFEELKLTRLELIIDPQNWSSRNTARALGARCEGIALNKLFFDGEPHPAAVYGITP